MAQLMPLPLTVSCFSKIQIGFTFLVPTHPCSPGQRAVKRVCACVRACVHACVHVCVCVCHLLLLCFTTCLLSVSHRNTLIRNAVSALVVSIAETLGPGRVLSGIRDITDRILVTSAQFMLDSSPLTRCWHSQFSFISHQSCQQMSRIIRRHHWSTASHTHTPI